MHSCNSFHWSLLSDDDEMEGFEDKPDICSASNELYPDSILPLLQQTVHLSTCSSIFNQYKYISIPLGIKLCFVFIWCTLLYNTVSPSMQDWHLTCFKVRSFKVKALYCQKLVQDEDEIMGIQKGRQHGMIEKVEKEFKGCTKDQKVILLFILWRQ